MSKRLQDFGLLTPDKIRKQRRLMIGSDGWTNDGKTEFILSAPGPKVIMPIDRSFDGVLDNPHPPQSRDLKDTYFDIVNIPNLGGGQPFKPGDVKFTQDDFKLYFSAIRSRIYELIDIPELRTFGLDGHTDFWELQLLAEFGRLTQIHPMQYPPLYAAHRTIINRLWQSQKIIIATNKLKDKYEDVLDEKGMPVKDSSGKNVQVKVKGEVKRQGFPDQDYLFQIQIRHLSKKAEVKTIQVGPRKGQVIGKTDPEYGIRIIKCKPNMRLEGDELWGDKCNLLGLVQHVYPQVDPMEWGF